MTTVQSKRPVARPAADEGVTALRHKAGEILGRYSSMKQEDAIAAARSEIAVRAMNDGMNLSTWLEEQDPSWQYNDGMDAFERQLMLSGIRTQSDPAKGVFAHTVDRFYMSDQPASPILFPEFINRAIRTTLLTPPILEELVAITTPVDSDSYRTIYLQDTTATRRMGRVAEGSELPTVKVATSEKSVSLKKYGVRLIGTYEAFRRMRLDLFALHMSRIALQSQLDKSSEALDTLINGDGNSDAATNYNLTALDSSTTAGNLTYKAFLRWGMKLWPYQLTTIVGGEAEVLSLLTLQFPNINPLMLLSMLTQSGGEPTGMKLELAQGIWGTVRVVFFPLAPSNVLTGINKATALEMVTEVGASLTETDKIISKQWNEITISEVVGFSQLIPAAIETMTLNA